MTHRAAAAVHTTPNLPIHLREAEFTYGCCQGTLTYTKVSSADTTGATSDSQVRTDAIIGEGGIVPGMTMGCWFSLRG